MVSKVFEHPFDLTKVRLQSQVLDSSARFSGPLDCLTQTWKKEGLRGLYRVRSSTESSQQVFTLQCFFIGLTSSRSWRHGRKRVSFPSLWRIPKTHISSHTTSGRRKASLTLLSSGSSRCRCRHKLHPVRFHSHFVSLHPKM